MSDREFAAYPSLAGRTVLVSGGASGIGEAIVRAFAGQGAKIGFIDILEREGAALAAELGDAVSLCARRHYRSRRAGAASVILDELGSIQVLVNNAANDTRHDWRWRRRRVSRRGSR